MGKLVDKREVLKQIEAQIKICVINNKSAEMLLWVTFALEVESCGKKTHFARPEIYEMYKAFDGKIRFDIDEMGVNIHRKKAEKIGEEYGLSKTGRAELQLKIGRSPDRMEFIPNDNPYRPERPQANKVVVQKEREPRKVRKVAFDPDLASRRRFSRGEKQLEAKDELNKREQVHHARFEILLAEHVAELSPREALLANFRFYDLVYNLQLRNLKRRPSVEEATSGEFGWNHSLASIDETLFQDKAGSELKVVFLKMVADEEIVESRYNGGKYYGLSEKAKFEADKILQQPQFLSIQPKVGGLLRA